MLRKKIHWAYLILIIAPFVLFSPILLTGQALFWGTPSLQFVPWWSWAWETLHSGHLPLWNPLLGMGAPYIANYQSALFYPPNWIYILLGAIGGTELIAWGQTLLVVIHLCWAGLGMALLARRLSLNLLAQVVCGLSFSLSGYLVTRAGFLSINAATAWLPWIILGVTELVLAVNTHRAQKELVSIGDQDRSTNSGLSILAYKEILKKPALILIPSIGLQLLAGHAQTSWYTLLLAVIWGSALTLYGGIWKSSTKLKGFAHSHQEFGIEPSGISRGKHLFGSIRRILSMWGWLGLVLIFGISLAAIQLFPTAEYLLVSQRSRAVDYEFAMTYSFWPWRFLTLVAPKLFGDPATGDYWGYGYYWEDAIYIGLFPLILAIMAVFNGLKRKESWDDLRSNGRIRIFRLLPLLIIIILVSFLLALGKNTPVFPWLYKHISTFSMFQAPTRWTIWAEFALSLLAGIGINYLKRPTGRGLYWTRLVVAGAFAVSIGAGLAAIFSENLIGSIKPSFLRTTALTGMWGVVAGFLMLTAPSAPFVSSEEEDLRKNWWFWGVSIFIAVDLLVAGWGQNPGISRDLYRTNPEKVAQVLTLLEDQRLFIFPEDEDNLKYDRFFRANTFAPPEDSSGWENLRDTFLPNLTLLDGIPTVNNFDPLVPGRYQEWISALDQAPSQVQSQLLNLMGVKIVETVDNLHPFGVHFQINEPYPQFQWLPCSILAEDGDQALSWILNEKVDIEREVVLETDNPVQSSDCLEKKDVSLQKISSSPNNRKVEIKAESNGFLLLSDVWYPGWKAWIDDTPVPIIKADYLFQALSIPPGRHVVTFAYRPIWFYAGLVISIIAWLALGYLWVK
jgi:hypothetical protein